MNPPDALLFLKKKLQSTILQLQSDEILQQMRNDQTLAQFKRQHIKQLIKQELQLQTTVENMGLQISQLKEQLFQKEDLITQIRQEYTELIQNIEHDWERYRSMTENDKKSQQEKYQRELDILREDSQSKTKQIKILRSEIDRYKKQSQNLKEDRYKLQQNKATLQESIGRLKKQLQQKHDQVTWKNQQLEEKRENQIDNYEEIIERMKKDMQYIRECWQKKCNAIEAELKEENNMLVLHYQQKMRKELKEYAENLKLGNSIVITDSEEIIAKRMEKIQQEYAQQINKIEEEMEEISKVYLKTKQEIEEKERIIKQLEEKNGLLQREKERIVHQNQLKNTSLAYEANSLKQIQKKMQLQLKEGKQKSQELIKEKQTLQEQILSLNKKVNQKSVENEQLVREIQSYSSKIKKINSSYEDAVLQLEGLKKLVVTKDQSLSSKQFQLEAAKRQRHNLQPVFQQLKSAKQKLSVFVRSQRQQKKKMTVTFDKLHIIIRKLKKDNDILREEVKCSLGMLKTKFPVEIQQMLDFFMRSKQQIDRRNKLKMNELIDQMQAKEKELMENLASQKQQLKLELDQSIQSLQKKNGQLEKYKNTLKDSQQERKNLAEDLQKQRVFVGKLEEKIDQQRDVYQNTINRLQKDIGRSLTHFYNKWSENISQLQGQLEAKQVKIKACVEKMDQLIQQIQQNRKRADWAQQEVKKYRKKYQQVRKERDAKIQNLLKQLQQEGKHRLNLERQLKQVRLSIMRGTTNNSVNFSFNEKEKDYNVVTSYKNTGITAKQAYNNQREKQLSQIREMIAKTYKVVGDTPIPQKDLTKNLSRKHLF